jgi:hypothetical protein
LLLLLLLLLLLFWCYYYLCLCLGGKGDFDLSLSLPPFLKPLSQNTTITLHPLRRFQFDFAAQVSNDNVPEYDFISYHFLISFLLCSEFDILFSVFDVKRNATSTRAFRIIVTRELDCLHVPDSVDDFTVHLETNYSLVNARETAKIIV